MEEVGDRGRATIATLAYRHGAASVCLFGSNADRRRQGRDLALAVEGVAPARFFRFVGDLMLSQSKPNPKKSGVDFQGVTTIHQNTLLPNRLVSAVL